MANRIVEVEFHTIVAGQLAVNVMHFMGDTPETDLFVVARSIVRSLDGTDANTGFDATKYMAAISASAWLSALVARVVGVAPGSKYPKLYTDADFPGALSSGVYSTTVAGNIKLVTASGPDFTGRVFLPGVAPDQILENRFQSTYETAIDTWRSDYQAGIDVGAVTFEPVVYNRTTKTAELVTNTALSPNPGTIRKRATPY